MTPTFDDLLGDAADLGEVVPPAPEPTTAEQIVEAPHAAAIELTVNKKTGEVRQAGADSAGAWLIEFKKAAERSLYTFAVGVLGRTYLNRTLHLPWCDGLQRIPPHRKLRLLPRFHGKTSVVSQALPIHMFIQPEDANGYFPGMAGSETTILLAGEKDELMEDNLRVIATAFESNERLRGLWPHRCWDRPRAESKKWNEHEMILPRQHEYPDPSIRAVGVGSAVTGKHPRALIKDDLISFDAANSPAVMQTAIQWHKASYALIEGDASALEFIIGTRWAAHDLYQYIIDSGDDIDIDIRAMVEDGVAIYPEKFDARTVDKMRLRYGDLFPYLFMNTAVGAGVTDFSMSDVRFFEIVGRSIRFAEDERDLALRQRIEGRKPTEQEMETVAATGWDGETPTRDDYVRQRWPHRMHRA